MPSRSGSFGATLDPFGRSRGGLGRYNVSGATIQSLAEYEAYAISVAWSNGQASDEEYLARRMREKGGFILAAYVVVELASRELPADAVVLIVGDAQHLYLRRRHRYTYLSAATPYRAFEDRHATDEEVAARLKAEGVTHVLFNPRELSRLQGSKTVGFAPEHNRRVEAFLGGPAVRLLASTNVNEWPVFLFELR